MDIQLKQVVPLFLEKEKIARSEIWGNDVTCRAGERIQVTAPSGSGKTSLVHFLYGMRKDYSGDVLAGGKKLRKHSLPALAELRAKHISIVFQDLRLFNDISVKENLEVKRSLAPFHAVSRILEMAQRLGIGNKMQQKAGLCSYGEQQRVAIIRALQQPFDVLIMDEPFSHLDTANSHTAMALIEEECLLRNATIILADLQPLSFFNSTVAIHL